MKMKDYASTAFIIVGALTACEFIFVQGLFTWLMAVMATYAVGLINIVINLKNKEYKHAMLYLLCCVALTMGYYKIL